MILNYYENSLIRNNKLPPEWQSQTALDGLLDFLQSNWEQRAIFYDDGKVNSKQSFLEFVYTVANILHYCLLYACKKSFCI